MNRTTSLATKRVAILALAARHGAHNVRVFGSRARGTAQLELVWVAVERELPTFKAQLDRIQD